VVISLERLFDNQLGEISLSRAQIFSFIFMSQTVMGFSFVNFWTLKLPEELLCKVLNTRTKSELLTYCNYILYLRGYVVVNLLAAV
jgi:hypothetical protein